MSDHPLDNDDYKIRIKRIEALIEKSRESFREVDLHLERQYGPNYMNLLTDNMSYQKPSHNESLSDHNC